MTQKPISVAITENQHLVRKGIVGIINEMDQIEVMMEAVHGRDLLDQLEETGKKPDVVLLGISMPVLNGYDTLSALLEKDPNVKVIICSSYISEVSVVRMLVSGALAFLDKECDPRVLEEAIRTVAEARFYHSELVSNQVFARIKKKDLSTLPRITQREQEVLIHCCSELSYKEIADAMGISMSTVNGYREMLFEKLGVKSRTGLAMYALNMGLGEAR